MLLGLLLLAFEELELFELEGLYALLEFEDLRVSFFTFGLEGVEELLVFTLEELLSLLLSPLLHRAECKGKL